MKKGWKEGAARMGSCASCGGWGSGVRVLRWVHWIGTPRTCEGYCLLTCAGGGGDGGLSPLMCYCIDR